MPGGGRFMEAAGQPTGWIVQRHATRHMCKAHGAMLAIIHHCSNPTATASAPPCLLLHLGQQQAGKIVVPKMVGPELQLEAVLGVLLGPHSHHLQRE